jgi:hypothetical protein
MKIENQLDPKWNRWYIGKVKTSKFKDYACFLFCLTYLYSLKVGRQISPGVVDGMFVAGGAYDGDMIISEKAAEILGLDYFGKEFDINKPPMWHPSIKQVDFSIAGGKQSHFVIREVVDGKNVILDPYGGVQRSINFYEKKVGDTEWKTKFFSYRLFKV